MDGWMVGWMVGWLDGWMDRWMVGYVDRYRADTIKEEKDRVELS